MKKDSTGARGGPDPGSPAHSTKDQGWLDKPANVNKIVYALYTICALLLASDLIYHRHSHFGFEGWFGFYAFFGFLAFTAVVLAGKYLRKLLMRSEDYYDR